MVKTLKCYIFIFKIEYKAQKREGEHKIIPPPQVICRPVLQKGPKMTKLKIAKQTKLPKNKQDS